MLQLSPHGEIAVPIPSKSKSLDQFVKRAGTAPRPQLRCGTRERRVQFIVILILIMVPEAISGAPRLRAFAHWGKASQFEAFSLRSALVRSSNPPVPNGCRRSSASPAGPPKLRPQSRGIPATRRGAMAVRERISALQRLPASMTGHPPDFLKCRVWVSSRASRHQR
jgi:hypothetical protein